MPRFEKSESSKTVANGYYHVTITDLINITERVSQYADIAFELLLSVENVPFEIQSSIFIKFERDANGELDPAKNSWVNTFNNFLDTIKYEGGFDKYGVFRNANGDELSHDEMLEELHKHYTQHFDNSGYPFITYLYKDNKGYMKAVKRIYPISEKKSLESFVEYFLKTKKTTMTTPASSQRRL